MQLFLLRTGVVRKFGGPVPVYLIRTDDGTTVLVDTGYARERAGAWRLDEAEFIAMDEADVVTEQLAALGVRPSDVRYVVCTHLDPDHAGNHDAFPDAEFVIQAEHLAAARSGAVPRLQAAAKHWDLPHLAYREVDGDTELLPGIELIATGGHVPGHQSVLVRLPETGPVLLAADAVPMRLAADPDTRPVLPFDLDADAVRASTRKLQELAAREKALVVYGHDPEQWAGLPVAPDHFA